MATEIADAYVALYVRMPGVQQEIARQLGQVNGHGAGQRIGQDVGSGIDSGLGRFALGGAIAGAFAAMTSSIMSSMSQLANEAVTASDATDKFKGTLAFAGLDTSNIERLTAETQKYADETVYSLGDIQNITSQLAANSVKDYDKLGEAAGNLNAVAGGNAETFKSLGMVLTQTAGQGKLTTENWNQLSDAIPGASGRLQEAMIAAGAYTGNFRDAMAAGEITAEEFNAALLELGSEPIAVEAATSVTTFEGMLGNLEATIVGELSNGLTALKPMITDVGSAFSTGLGPALGGVVDMGVAAGGVLKGIWDILATGDFTGLAGLDEDSGIVGFLFSLRELGPGVVDVLSALWDVLGAAGTVIGALMEAVAPFASTLVELGADVLPGVADGVRGFADGFAGMTDWMPLITSLLAGLAGAMLLYKGATIAVSVASGIATAAQWAWNAAMAANPITLIVLAIAALVAGLVWFFTQTELGKEIWANVTQFFVDAWNNVVAFFSTAWDAIIGFFKGALDWILDLFFTWHPLGIIIANWEPISEWLAGFWDGIVQGVTAGIDAIVGVFAWLYEGVKPVLDGIGAVVAWLWDAVISVAVISIQAAIWALGEVFTWLWTNAIQPAVDGIAGLFTWFHETVVLPIAAGIMLAFQGLGLVVEWLYVNVVQPVFNAIATAFTWLYENTILGFQLAVSLAIQAIGAVIDWLYTSIVQPVFNAIGATFTWLYENVVRPVWSGIQTSIQVVADWITGTLWPGIQLFLGYMGTGFELLKTTIAEVWENIKQAAIAPVRFLVDVVYTDGIKKLFDKIAETVKIEERMPEIKLAFAGGGVMPGHVLPGRTPGRDVFDYISPNGGGHLRLGGGESIMVTEFADYFGRSGIALLNSLAKRGKLGELFGGTRAYADGGIWDAVGATVSGAGDWLASVADSVAKIVSDPAGAIDKLIREPIKALTSGMAGGFLGDALVKVPLNMIDKVAEWFATLLAPTTQGANTGDWVGGNTLNRLLPLIAATGTIITDTYRDPAYNAAVGGSPTSYHMDAANPAVDVAGSNAAMWAFYDLVMANGPWRQVLWQVAGHYDHVHVANRGGVYGDLPSRKYDAGGYLAPGRTVVDNLTGKPEPVFTSEQWDVLRRSAGSMPSVIEVRDVDGVLIGRMKTEATDVVVRALEEVR